MNLEKQLGGAANCVEHAAQQYKSMSGGGDATLYVKRDDHHYLSIPEEGALFLKLALDHQVPHDDPT